MYPIRWCIQRLHVDRCSAVRLPCSVVPAQGRPTEQVTALPLTGPLDPGRPELTRNKACVHVKTHEVLSTNGRAPIGPIVVTRRVTTSGPAPSRDNVPTNY